MVELEFELKSAQSGVAVSLLHHGCSASHGQPYLTRSCSINIDGFIGCGLPSVTTHQFGG